MFYKFSEQTQDSFEELIDQQAQAKGYITTEEIFLMFNIKWCSENICALEQYFGKKINFKQFQEVVLSEELIELLS